MTNMKEIEINKQIAICIQDINIYIYIGYNKNIISIIIFTFFIFNQVSIVIETKKIYILIISRVCVEQEKNKNVAQ